MHDFDFLVFPFLDRIRQEAGLLVGIREVVMLFLEGFQCVVASGCLVGGVGMGHEKLPFCVLDNGTVEWCSAQNAV